MNSSGTRIGAWRLLEPLGRGGMGIVWRAAHADTGVHAALKTIGAPDERRASAIRHEIAALAAVDHPGIVRILDHGVAEGLPWMAMQIVEGRTLREAFPVDAGDASAASATRSTVSLEDLDLAPSALDPEVALRPPRDLLARLTLVRRLCSALAYLHGEGLVHRDLKPDNVLVRADGCPVLVDFGLAGRFLEGRSTLAAESRRAGTLGYLAPEQLAGEAVDARADLYALGCLLFELLVGQPPVRGSLASVSRQLLHGRAPRLSEVLHGIPPTLDALVAGLLEREPRDRPGHAEVVAVALAGLGADPPPGPTPPPRPWLYRARCSGREGPLRALGASMQRPGLLFVVGESGAGKTRLALEAAQRVRSRTVEVVHGECLPDSGTVYGGLTRPLQWLADRCRSRTRDQAQEILRDHAPVLAALEPSFSSLPGGDAPLPPLAGPDARLRLWTATVEALRAASQGHLALILDDLQWADDLTLGLVEFAARSPSGLALIATVRAEEIPDRLVQLLEQAEVLRLGPLDADAVGAMASDMLGQEQLPGAFVRWLAGRVEGNPFFVTEALRGAMEEGVLARDPEGRWTVARGYEALGLPRSARETVARRLARLGAQARAVAEAAAVLGRRVELEPVAALLGWDPSPAVPELLRQQVWLEEDGLRFAHDQLREVLLEELGPERRRALHGAAADLLDRLPGRERRLAELADHAAAAGQPERARDAWWAAGLRAERWFGQEEAIRWLRAGLAVPGGDPDLAVRARFLLGQALVRTGRAAEGSAEQDRAWSEAGPETRAELGAARSMDLFRQGRTGEAIALARETAGQARQHQLPEAEAEARTSLCRFLAERGELVAARAEAERALALTAPDQAAARAALHALSVVDVSEGRLEEGAARLEVLLAQERAAGSRRGEFLALSLLSVALYGLDRLAEAEALYDRILALTRAVGDRHQEGCWLCNRAVGLAELGFPEEALAAHEAAAALLHATRDLRFGAINDIFLARLLRWLGRQGASLEALDRGAAAADQAADGYTGVLAACERGHQALIAGEPAEPWLALATAHGEPAARDVPGRAVRRLRRAMEAVAAGEALVRGEREEEVPADLRARLGGG